jgi:hypothetical protein
MVPIFIKMRLRLLSILLLFLLSGLYGSDRQLILGEEDNWESANLTNLSLTEGKRGYLDITNKDNAHKADKFSDLIYSFNSGKTVDETGHYEITTPLSLSQIEGSYGGSAAMFDGEEPLLLEAKDNALFLPSTLWDDFTLEFRIYAATLKEGSTVFLWKGLHKIDNSLVPQEIRCTVNNRSLVWDFENFFLYPDYSLNRVSLKGDKMIPGEWSHHMIIFDSNTGLLEYRINNIPSDSTYTSRVGREVDEFNIPLVGNQQSFPIELGENFTGLIDELRISHTIINDPQLYRYTSSGVMETAIIDLYSPDSTLKSVLSEEKINGNTSIKYEIATAQTKLDLIGPDINWEHYIPGEEINRKTRFLKIRAFLYAEPATSQAPVLSSLTVTYREASLPHPPLNVQVANINDKLHISWDKSIDPTIDGYMVYYGEEPGVYFSTGSPLDVGDETSAILNNININRRYYLAVTSYRIEDMRIESSFSREISYSP